MKQIEIYFVIKSFIFLHISIVVYIFFKKINDMIQDNDL